MTDKHHEGDGNLRKTFDLDGNKRIASYVQRFEELFRAQELFAAMKRVG